MGTVLDQLAFLRHATLNTVKDLNEKEAAIIPKGLITIFSGISVIYILFRNNLRFLLIRNRWKFLKDLRNYLQWGQNPLNGL